MSRSAERIAPARMGISLGQPLVRLRARRVDQQLSRRVVEPRLGQITQSLRDQRRRLDSPKALKRRSNKVGLRRSAQHINQEFLGPFVVASAGTGLSRMNVPEGVHGHLVVREGRRRRENGVGRATQPRQRVEGCPANDHIRCLCFCWSTGIAAGVPRSAREAISVTRNAGLANESRRSECGRPPPPESLSERNTPSLASAVS